MSKIQIITDSAADILVEDVAKYSIEVVPFKVAMGDNSYTSNVDFTNDEFYKMLDDFEGIPTTSQITPFEFEELYADKHNQGVEELILVLINSKGSATYNNAIMARNNFFEENPDAEGDINIHIFDGAGYNGIYGWPVIEAAKLVQEGADIDTVISCLKEELSKKQIYFGMYSLKYTGKSGRIPSAAAFVGEVIGLKPIMKIWDHEIVTANKAKGEKKMMTTVINMTLESMEEGSPYSVVYGSDKSVADEIAAKLTDKLGYGPTYIFQIGAAVAINAGPKVVGVIFDSKERMEVTEA
ncbi:MAG: DegV family protein [Lachnospiraceae bacterium]|nr:DegV family protein [Lachnospiraceae bacterium]